MPSQPEISVLCESTADFWDRFEKMVRSFEGADSQLTLTVEPGSQLFNGRGTDLVEQEGFTDAMSRIRSTPLPLVRSVSYSTHLPNKGSLKFHVNESNGFSIPVRWTHQPAPSAESIQKLSEVFKVVTPGEAVALNLPEVADNRFAAYQDAITSLKETVAELSRIQAKAVTDNTEFLSKVTSEFGERILDKETELLEKRREQEAEFAAERQQLDNERSELNLRESRKVRRELLEKMEKVVENQTKFERSAETKSSDRAVFWVSGLLILAGLAIAGGAMGLLAADKLQPNLFYPPFVAGLLLAASNAFVLAWHSVKKTKRHADTDFAIMQYSRDMYRMSWITELVFEAETHRIDDQEAKVEVPEALLDAFSRSLFADTRDGNSSHPLDELHRYAKRFKKFTIGSNGVEAEVEKDAS